MIHAKFRAVLMQNTKLASLVSNRIYPIFAPQNPVYPLILYRQISRLYNYDTDGRDALLHARIQIDCYAKTLSETHSIAAAIREALDKKAFEIRNDEDYEVETSIYRVSLDFNIWEDQI